MHRLGLVSLCAVAAMGASLQSGFAQDKVDPGAAVPTNVLFGTVKPAIAGPSNRLFCTIPSGTLPYNPTVSAFQRSGSGDAFIQLDTLDYYVAPWDTNLAGWVQLHFTRAAGGSVILDYPAESQNLNTGTIATFTGNIGFSAYTQSFNGKTGELTVSFNLNFANPSCSLPIRATYHNLG